MKKIFLTSIMLFSLLSHAATHQLHFKTNDAIWGFDFIDNDRLIYTEKKGLIKLYNLKTKQHLVLLKPKQIAQKGQGGLLDLKLHPDFKLNQKVYYTYAKKIGSEYTTALSVAQFKNNKLINSKEIFVAKALSNKGQHFGSRLTFDQNNQLYMSIGDRGFRDEAQNLKSHKGKILKLDETGKASKDNPYLNNDNALDEIWSYGHRNPQGIFYDKTKNLLWETEFGPRGGDELNLIRKKYNFGWPVITYGREYWGPKIGTTHKQGMEQPIAYWKPSISPSGMIIYRKNKYPEWKGKFFLANLSSKHIRMLSLKNKKVEKQTIFLNKLGWRFRGLNLSPDGRLFFSTDHGHFGELIPKK